MTSNSYFDGETQQGFLPGMSGCVEHATISQEALRDARQNHRSICFAWVDLRNAFGSVWHMLVQHCLQRYHFPPHICRLVFDYYEQLHAKVSVEQEIDANFSVCLGGFSRLCPFTGPIQHLFSATSGLSAPQGNLQWMELQLQVQSVSPPRLICLCRRS